MKEHTWFTITCLVILLIIALALGSWLQADHAAMLNMPHPDASAITVTNETDVPEVKLRYKTALRDGITLTVTTRYSSITERVSYDGELVQKDGRWVFFDPEKPADRILDKDLLPEIDQACAYIIGIDTHSRHTMVDSYTDKTGTTWLKMSEKVISLRDK